VRGPGAFEREVALKLTHAHLREDPTFTIEVLDEAHLAARIRHPNVVPVLEVGEDPLGVFLVMDYIEGDSLAGLVRRGGPLPARIGARILVEALAGLHAAHELTDGRNTPLGLVHRDFSPQNLLVGIDGVTRLVDFGIAKAASRLGHTATGIIKGKVAYMAPEQAHGHPLDRRCDIWAAGVVAWEVVAGRKLYPNDDNGMVTLLKVVSEDPPRLGHVLAGIAPALDVAVARALERRVEARYPTASDFRAALVAAFRTGEGIAETDEVAAYASDLLTPQITARRARVEQVLSLRAVI
jgi:serine/threonine-protein kinase